MVLFKRHKNKKNQQKQESINSREPIEKIIKKDVLRRWAEAEKKAIPVEELYDRMVSEAVLTIEDAWQASSERMAYKIRSDSIEVEAFQVFSITEDLKLYSTKTIKPRNPATNKDCFFDVLEFQSKEIADKYVNDVFSRLPKGTVMGVYASNHSIIGKCLHYTFSLKIDMTT